ASHRPSLEEFVRQLRGTLNLLLADCLVQPTGGDSTIVPPVNLRLLVSRIDHGVRSSVSWSTRAPEAMLRDLRRVPKVPDSVQLSLEQINRRDRHVVVLELDQVL